MSQRLASALYYARKRRRVRQDANPAPPGRIMFGSWALYVGNESILTGTEDDVQLADALAALSGNITIGGDNVTIEGNATVEGAAVLQGAVTASGLATADGAVGVLWQDNAAARAVKVSA